MKRDTKSTTSAIRPTAAPASTGPDALTWADTCVLVLPCGRSAHTEAGWMAGAGKRVLAYLPEMVEPELMYKLFDGVAGSLEELVEKLYLDRDVEFLRPGLSE